MAATFKIAGLDLSAYLRLGEDTLDPVGGQFEEPSFLDAPGEGQPLVNVDAKNREMAFPIWVNPLVSVSTTKDAINAVVQSIVAACRVVGAQVEWKDDGATNSTFYDIEYARFEPAYRYLPARKLWLAGTVRVFADPYGKAAADRVITSAATLAPYVDVPVASVGGDVAAQLNWKVLAGASYADVQDRPTWTMVAVVPSGYPTPYPGASLLSKGGTMVVGGSFVGSAIQRTINTTQQGYIATYPLGTNFAGRHRLFAMLRTQASTAYVCAWAYGAGGIPFTGATVTINPDTPNTRANQDWRLFDLGVLDMTGPAALAVPWSTGGVQFGAGASGGGAYPSQILCDVGYFLWAPEDNYTLFRDQAWASNGSDRLTPNAAFHYLEATGMKSRRMASAWASGQKGGPRTPANSNMDAYRFGDLPTIATAGYSVRFWRAREGGLPMDGSAAVGTNQFATASLGVRDRFFFQR